MKLSTLGACLVLVLVAALPFQPWSRSSRSASSFEMDAQSDASGVARLYYSVGRGLNEKDSGVQPVVAGQTNHLRFALPCGRLYLLRLGLLNRNVHMTLSQARVVDSSGRVLARIAPGQFKATFDVASVKPAGDGVEIQSNPLAGDPQVDIAFSDPLRLPGRNAWLEMAAAFAAVVIVVFGAERLIQSERPRAAAVLGAARASPGRTIALAAVLGVVAANYPVVFAGKSFVSPNLGTALLYGQLPWVPGFQSLERGDPNFSDIDALMWHHLPLSMIQHRALFRDHELPLWNRYDSAGTPLLGQGQSCLGDPLHLIPLLADGAPWAWDLKFLLAKMLYALAIGLCVWRLTRHLTASVLMTVSAPFIGFFVYRINHPAIFSLCYSPWILYLWLRIVDCVSPRRRVLWMGALIGANFVEMCSGTAKEAYILLLSMNFTGVCILLGSARSLASKFRLLAALAGAGAVFAMISAPMWYTFFAALRNSFTVYESPQSYQLQPGMLIGLFDEIFYRPFQIFPNVINPSANFLILCGMLWAIVRWRTAFADRITRAVLVSCLPALALVYGLIPPAAIARVPFLGNILHIDNTFSCVLVVLFTVLAGMGWKEAWNRLGSPAGRADGVLVLLLLAGLYAVYLGTVQAVVRTAYAEHTWGRLIKIGEFIHLYGLSLILGSALLLWVIHRALSRGAWTAALVVLGGLSFAALHWREGFQMGMAHPEYVVMPTRRVDLVASSPAIETIRANDRPPVRTIGFLDNFFPGWSIVYDLEGISGPDALMNRYYRELMGESGIERVWDWRYRLQYRDLAALRPVLDALNVRYYLDYPAGQRIPEKILKPVSSSDMELYESGSVWPRAFYTDSVAVYDTAAQYMSWIKAGDGRPFAAIAHDDWVGFDPLPRVSGDLATRKLQAAENYHLTTNTTSFTVKASGPGFIVLCEAYEPENFRATVNGVETPYFRINHAFKGIYVDAAGDYEVRFEYWPKGLSATLILSGAGILTALAAIVFAFLADRILPKGNRRDASPAANDPSTATGVR